MDDDILQHVDIMEQGKPTAFSLGKSLWIGNDVRMIYMQGNELSTVESHLSEHVGTMSEMFR